MRITAELLSQVECRINPNDERELMLRGLGIAAIENMAAARDDYDCWDLSNNRLTKLDNIPRVRRLCTLLCSGNLIDGIDRGNISRNAANIRSLTLSHNKISSLSEVSNIARACPKLEFLSLVGNPVSRRQHYRLFAIKRMPSLRVLDYARIKPSEREKAERLAKSSAGAMLEEEVREEAASAAASSSSADAPKTFVPGDSDGGGRSFVVTNFTPEQKETIRNLLANAKSIKEVEEIEESVRRGIVPSIGNGGGGGGGTNGTGNGSREKRGLDGTATTTDVESATKKTKTE